MIILGISAFYHDAAAAIIKDGAILAAAQEERFTRKKHDASFPTNAIKYCLEYTGVNLDQIDAIAFYDKPFLKFERLLETYYAFAPRGLRSFLKAMPVWIKEKIFLKRIIREELKNIGAFNQKKTKLLFLEHHLSHAASAFYPSPFEHAAILTIDGVGEWATASISQGKGRNIKILRELHFPHSLGLLYSAFTYYLGFKVNSGEYKLMGLAPYGDPKAEQTQFFIERIKSKLVDIKADGSIRLNQQYFNYAVGLEMAKDKAWEKIFQVKKRTPESDIEADHCNLAFAIQAVTEEIVLRMAKTTQALSQEENLCMAGGVALNCVANGKIQKEGIFKNLFIQPASGDAGGALGAALAAHYIYFENERIIHPEKDAMQGTQLGPAYSDLDVEQCARQFNATFQQYDKLESLCSRVAQLLEEGQVIGWFQGRMEYGPRALGNRSILGDPRLPEMQRKLNLKIKFRESFRPFAPAILEEAAADYFEIEGKSPYMLLVQPIRKEWRLRTEVDRSRQISEQLYRRQFTNDKSFLAPHRHKAPTIKSLGMIKDQNHLSSSVGAINKPYSKIPAITHVDFSARIQTVSKESNFPFWSLLSAFHAKTGCPILINTSFNVRGEPIVNTPEEAYRCFMQTNMDYLVLGNYFFDKKVQPAWTKEVLFEKD